MTLEEYKQMLQERIDSHTKSAAACMSNLSGQSQSTVDFSMRQAGEQRAFADAYKRVLEDLKYLKVKNETQARKKGRKRTVRG